MTTPAGILGLGARTAVGEDVAATMAAVRAGIAGFQEHPFMISRSGDPYVLARAPYLAPELSGIDRWLELAVPAAREALAPVAALKLQIPSLPIVVGIPDERPGISKSAGLEFGQQLAARLNDILPVRVEVVSTGHSGGLMAVERGLAMLAGGKEGLCLAGGVDSYVEPDTLDWIESVDRLHSPENPYGFIPGEAAGFSLLAGPEIARRHRPALLGEIMTVRTAREKNLIMTDSVCIGQGLTEAFRSVLQGLPGKVDEVICDANGEPYRADEYGFAVSRLSEQFARAADYVAPADCWGDVGAASGPLFIGWAITAARRNYTHGPITLAWTSSDAGHRSAAIVRAFRPEGGPS